MFGWLVVMAAIGCDGRLPPPPVERAYEDLLLPFEVEGEAGEPRVFVWPVGDSQVPVLFLHAPGRLEIGPFPASAGCALHFTPAISPRGWEGSDGVEFIVTIRGEHEERRIFSQWLTPAEGTGAWGPRRVEFQIGSPFSVVLATEPGPDDDTAYDQAAWGAPYLECQREIPRPRKGRPNVVIVSVDTLRADHLGVYGYPGHTSPAMDRLAESSLVFEAAFSVAPYTLPSHASLLTGLSPRTHGAGEDFPEAPMREDVPTLAGALAGEGYRTMAITSGGLVSRQFGLSGGFDLWVQRQRARFDTLLPAVLDLVDDDDAPFFLFLHTYDVHGPYLAPEVPSAGIAFESSEANEQAWSDVVELRYHEYQKLSRFNGPTEVVAAYDAGVAWADGQIGRLLTSLQNRGVLDDTLLILTSDHGETLYRKGRYFGHSHTLADDELRIPLIVRFPGAERKGVSSELVQILDIAPMVLDWLGIDRPAQMEGHNPLSGEDPRTVVEGWSSHLGAAFARTRHYKVISPPSEKWSTAAKVIFGPLAARFDTGWQVYALDEDPDETVNLATPEGLVPDGATPLIDRALALRTGRSGGTAGSVPEELTEQLRALGYVR